MLHSLVTIYLYPYRLTLRNCVHIASNIALNRADEPAINVIRLTLLVDLYYGVDCRVLLMFVTEYEVFDDRNYFLMKTSNKKTA